MKSNKLYIFSFFITLLNLHIVFGQGLVDRSSYQFVDVYNSTMANADIDGDGDLDFFISGSLSHNNNISKIYFNDGKGEFSEASFTQIEGLSYGSSFFSDFDGDLDLDLIISGKNNGDEAKTNLYLNDGNGKFTKTTDSTSLTGLYYSSISISDIDGDLDNDIFITGYDPIVSDYVSKLYINNGSANFSEQANTFIPLAKSSASFGDIDNDSDQDLIVSGALPNNQVITHVYENIENGIFKKTSNHSLSGTMNSTITLRDFDLDNDLDLLIIGNKDFRKNVISKLYLNNGTGFFEESWKMEEDNTLEVYAAFSDLNSDNYIDITYISPFKSVNYINLQNGSFQKIDRPELNGSNGSILSFDVDNDGVSEILVSSRLGCKGLTTLYSNDGSGSIKEASKTPFKPYLFSSMISGDIDNDNDLDIIISGHNAGELNTNITIYENNGEGIFSIKNDSSLSTNNNSKIAFIDANGDNYLDLIMSVLDKDDKPITKLMLNNKAGSFEEDKKVNFSIDYFAKFIIDDIDQDGDSDILISDNSSLSILVNTGSGEFIKKEDFSPKSLKSNTISFIDIDGDSDSDILEMGGYINNLESRLYINDGNGNYQKVTSNQFENSFSFAYGDIDGDLDQDIIIAGVSPGYNLPPSLVKIMVNKNNAEFEELSTIDIPLAYYINLELEDIDGDGDQDLLMTGIEYLCGNSFSNVYLNDRRGDFQLSQNANLKGIHGSYIINDFDGDLDMDIVLSGTRGGDNVKANVTYYSNEGSLCTPSNYTDTIFACDSISWIDGKSYTKSNNSAFYSYETSLGCDSIINLDLTISYSSYIENTVNATGEYQWIDGNTYYQSNNTATYTLTNQSGCDSTVSLNLTLIPLANELKSSIALFPNPSGEQLKFNLGYEPEENLEYQIFNTSGLEMKTWESSLKEQLIDISPLPSGTYILKYQEGFKSESLKFVKR